MPETRMADDQASEPRAPIPTGILLYIWAILFYIAASVAVKILFDTITSDHHRWATVIAQFGAILLPALVVARWQNRKLADGLRLHPVSPIVVVAAVAGIILLSSLLQVVVLAQDLYLIPESWIDFYLRDRSRIIDFQRDLIGGATPVGVIGTYLLMVVLPGICEELFFRGVMQRNFEWRMRPAQAIILTALLFAMLHLQLVNVLLLASLGAYLGYLTWRTGSVIPSIAAHMAFNAIMTTGAYLYPDMLEPRRYTVDDLLDTLPIATLSLGLLLIIIAWLNRRYAGAKPITLER